RLIRTDRVGPATFKQLIQRFGSAKAALAGLPEIAARGGSLKAVKAADESEIARELAEAKRLGAVFVAMGEPEYPQLLRHFENAPPVIAVLGDLSALSHVAIGVVGSRSASTNGLAFSRKMSAELSNAGFVVASGLARGIDRAAHEGAISQGGTIAVLAGGLDRPYPPQNLDLYNRLKDHVGSCLISTMPFGYEPVARDFPRRNSIIAGLSIAVVVVEAAEKSGSLITARMATEAGRVVFAIPGHPVDPRSAGTNGLIREGAELARSADDIIQVVKPMVASGPMPGQIPTRNENAIIEPTPQKAKELPASLKQLVLPRLVTTTSNDDLPDLLFALLGPAPTSVDDLVRESGQAASKVQAALLELELAGRIERTAGGVVSAII
ncbi:MAG: DNA-processing protein DprA, partial [Notoacmeibacter sp.]